MTKEAMKYFNRYKELILDATVGVDDSSFFDKYEPIHFNLTKNNRVIEYTPGIPWRICDKERVLIGWNDVNANNTARDYFMCNNVRISGIVCNDQMDLILHTSNGISIETYTTVTEYNECWKLKDMAEEYYEFIVTGEGVVLIENGEAYEL